MPASTHTRFLQLQNVAPRTYGCDPYNTLDAPALNERIIRSYHGPLDPIAYRSHRNWDFAAGVSSIDKLLSYRTQASVFMQRQGN